MRVIYRRCLLASCAVQYSVRVLWTSFIPPEISEIDYFRIEEARYRFKIARVREIAALLSPPLVPSLFCRALRPFLRRESRTCREEG